MQFVNIVNKLAVMEIMCNICIVNICIVSSTSIINVSIILVL